MPPIKRRILTLTLIWASLLFLMLFILSFQVRALAEVKELEPTNPDLMAWWRLNEGTGTVVFDSSGNDYQGTLHGANWINNKQNNYLNFNGASDYVSLPSLDLTNLDSLTVVAWINSDLTRVGYIIYHGNLGEFEMGNGYLAQEAQALNINSTFASFSVKLSDFDWYRVQSSSPMEPNTWHQIVAVWVKGVSMKIYLDGDLVGENNHIPALHLFNPGSSCPSSLGIYSQNQWNIQNFFKGQISNVMVYNKALTTQEISALYTTPILPKPTLNLSCRSSTSNSGFNVKIRGSLTINETAIPYAPVLLSYSVTEGRTWEDLTLVYTGSDGAYSANWLPQVTGNYLVKAVYEGDVDKLCASSEIVNFAVTEFAEKNSLFSISSNSTITSFAFNSTTYELSFNISGPSETTGYVQLITAKNLFSNPEKIRVYLDGNQLNYSVVPTEDSWLITLTYSHSTHRIIMCLESAMTSNVSFNVDYRVLLGVVISLTAALILIIVILVPRRKKNSLDVSK
jgi:hypothetical protein